MHTDLNSHARAVALRSMDLLPALYSCSQHGYQVRADFLYKKSGSAVQATFIRI